MKPSNEAQKSDEAAKSVLPENVREQLDHPFGLRSTRKFSSV
jgi:hypothetical protein